MKFRPIETIPCRDLSLSSVPDTLGLVERFFFFTASTGWSSLEGLTGGSFLFNLQQKQENRTECQDNRVRKYKNMSDKTKSKKKPGNTTNSEKKLQV